MPRTLPPAAPVRPRRAPFALLPAALLLLAACGGAPRSAPGPTPAAAPSAAPLTLPPVDPVRGAPLAVRVQYPAENQLVASRDSNFILGQVGSGDATLTINGVPVPIAANGAFIGFVANPPGPNPAYELVATRGGEVARATRRIRYPARAALLAGGPLRVDSGSLTPGRVLAREDEMLRVSVRAPENAAVWVQGTSGAPRIMPPFARTTTTSTAGPNDDTAVLFATDVPAALLAPAGGAPQNASQNAPQAAPRAAVYVARGSDTVRLAIPAPELVDPTRRALGMLRTSNLVGSDTDRVVHARTIPDGTYKWLLMPGTVLEITGRQRGFTRVRLDGTLDVWVDDDDIRPLAPGVAASRRVTAGLRVVATPEYSELVIATGERPAFLVEPEGPDLRQLTLTLYGTQGNPEISPIAGNDTLIRRVSWDQVTSDRVRVTLTLSRPVFGWLSFWDERRNAFVLRVRKPPTIDPARPLAGLVIAVDAGHPPAGSTGPTGLYEGDAVLPVAEIMATMLRERGATPLMTRTTKGPVGLTERAVMSRRANAHAFVSIHLNAFGDGTNPFTNNGTSTLFFHQHSEPLARPIQRELMKRLGLRDLGVHYQNLAIARPSWYPSALAEGAFVIIPEQEAAMRNPVYVRRYAEGLVAGLEAYFRELAR